jgi:GNAT superfamily N-acetyltransferase
MARVPPAVLERSEAEAILDWEAAPSAADRDRLGFASLRLGGGVVLAVREDPTGFWSKALGFERPVTGELIGRIDDFYRLHGVAEATIQLAPSVLPDDWDEIRATAHLSAGGTWVKAVCDTDVALSRTGHELDEGLRIGPVEPARAEQWAATMLEVFGMLNESSRAMSVASVGRPGWHPYAVWAGEEIVATATVHVHGETAQLFGGATRPEWRGRGAQTALIAARAQAARTAGCRWLVAETGAEGPGEHNSSLHNLRRAGFEVAYERTNWKWRPGPR